MRTYKQKAIARPYAAALFEVAEENGLTEQVYQDILLIHDVIRQNPEFRKVLDSPVIPPDKKRNVFLGVFRDKIQTLSLDFILLVTRKGREDMISAISDAFLALYRDHNHIHEVTVRTAAPLNAANRNKVIRVMESLLKGTIDLKEEIDPELVGGYQLLFEDLMYDESLSRHIRTLKKEFRENLFVKQF